MIKLKNILQSNLFLLFLFIGVILYCHFHFYLFHKQKNIEKNVILKVKIQNIYREKGQLIIDGIAKKRIRIFYSYHDRKEKYQLGDTIIVEGILQTPSINTNFNIFNYRKYLKSNHIEYIMKASKIDFLNKNETWYYQIKNQMIDRIDSIKGKDYIYAFLLGDTNYLKVDIKKGVQMIGISHAFAISGMHLSFLSIMIMKMLSFIPYKNLNIFLCIVFLCFYTFLTGFSPSVLRATLFFILNVMNQKFRWSLSEVKILLFLVCLFLFYNPFYIYHLGFLFSFIVSFFLLLCTKIKKEGFFRILISSFVSFLASIPILLSSFYSFNILSILYNLVFIPLISAVIFPFTFFVFLFPNFQGIYDVIVSFLEFCIQICSSINTCVIFPKMPIIMYILYYVSLFLFVYSLKKMYILFLLFLLFLLYMSPYFRRYSTVTVIDVGQGDCILLELKSGENILIDTGGNLYNKGKLSENTILPYLKSRGIRFLHALILTHGDVDHMGEAIDLVKHFKIGKVIFNGGEYNDLERELIKVLDEKNIEYYKGIEKLNINNNEFYFLNTKIYDNENDNSSVIYFTLDHHKFLFMGDAGIEVEENLILEYHLNDIDFFKTGHHGSKTSSSKKFIDIINPKYSVISVGKKNRYGHPSKEILKNLASSVIYRTDIDGSILFKIKDNHFEIETCVS